MTSPAPPVLPRRLLRAVAAGALGMALVAAAAEPDPNELLVSIQARYEKVETLRAAFEQVSRVASLGRDERASGSVVVARPGRMRWEYTSPEPSIIVLDEEAVRMYDATEHKLQIAPVGPDTMSPTALGFLLGESDLARTFRGELLETADPSELRLRLLPKEEAAFQHLELRLDAASYALRGSVLVDLFGNRTELLFHDVNENTPLAPDAFEIQIPDDAEVIDLR
jgi:outer membrane lipoprotein carrier protein